MDLPPPEPRRSKNYPLLDDDELTIFLGWQDLNRYNKIIHNKIAREAYYPETKIGLLFDGDFDQLTQSV